MEQTIKVGDAAAPCDESRAAFHRAETTRAELATEYGIRSAFMRAEHLEKILGISANSIRAQMRAGRFPVPHRKIGNVVVVKLDDFANWYGSEGHAARIARAQPQPAIRAKAPAPCAKPANQTSRISVPPRDETRKEWADRIRSAARLAVANAKPPLPSIANNEILTSPNRMD